MLEGIATCEPIVTRLIRARDCGLSGRTLAHAGPPSDDRALIPKTVLCGLAGAAVIEDWVSSFEQGVAAIVAGDIALVSNHALGIVSPMAGVVRPSQPLFVLDDAGGSGRRTYATMAEKGQRTLRFGSFDEDVVQRLAVLENEIAPAIAEDLPPGGLPILPILAEPIALGDHVHHLNVRGHRVSTSHFPLRSPTVLRYFSDHPQFFLNFAMAAA